MIIKKKKEKTFRIPCPSHTFYKLLVSWIHKKLLKPATSSLLGILSVKFLQSKPKAKIFCSNQLPSSRSLHIIYMFNKLFVYIYRKFVALIAGCCITRQINLYIYFILNKIFFISINNWKYLRLNIYLKLWTVYDSFFDSLLNWKEKHQNFWRYRYIVFKEIYI